MASVKPIIVTLTKGRHKTQPWSFVIDKPGPQNGETKRERYVTMRSAKRGAARVLGAFYGNRWEVILQRGTVQGGNPTRELRVIPVHFIIDERKKTKA